MKKMTSCCEEDKQGVTSGIGDKEKIEPIASSPAPKWTIEPMRREHIDKCLEIWGQVKLTEAYDTVVSALVADPGGFYVAQLIDKDTVDDDDDDDDGHQSNVQTTNSVQHEVIGMCAGTMTRSDTAFMGFYAVDPKYQRLGIGRELWAKTVARLDSSINIGLYGVPAMSEKYKKSGFPVEDTTRMLIYESEPNGEKELKISALKDIACFPGCRLEIIDGNTSEYLFRKLVDYDQSVQKFSREQLLRLYLSGNNVPLTFAIVRSQQQAAAATTTPVAVASKQLAASSRPILSTMMCDRCGDECHPVIAGPHTTSNLGTERKSSCCAKPSQESILEDETLKTIAKTNSAGETVVSRYSSHVDMSSVSGARDEVKSGAAELASIDKLASKSATEIGTHQQELIPLNHEEILGYGCIRLDNNCGGMIGPIYADSSDFCEVLLRNLIEQFKIKPGKVYSVMALSSNKQASKILTKLGLREVDQCSRMFTKFVPVASFSKIYYVHSPNFTLF